jgi:predicted DNA-binding protein
MNRTRNVGIRIYLPKEQVDVLKLIASHRGDTVSAVVRQAIAGDIRRYQRDEPHLLAPLQPRRNHEPS